MKKLLINVKTRFETSAEIGWDVAQDYTHFLLAHRRQFSSFDVLYDDGELQVFYYVSRPLPYFRYGVRFVSVRKLDHERMSLNQIYRAVDSRTPALIRFHFQLNPVSLEEVEWEGTYLYPVRGIAALLPGLFTKLFVRRIYRVWREDEELMTTRHRLGPLPPSHCEPYENPILSDELIQSLAEIENLKAKREDPETTCFDFPAVR